MSLIRRSSKGRDFASFIISAGIHFGLAFGLVVIPKQAEERYETVDLQVEEVPKPRVPDPPPEVEPEPEPEPEPEEPAPKKPPPPRPQEEIEPEPPPLAPPEEEVVPEEAEEAPPVFDLGDNTFAKGDGQAPGWSMARSEGNTKFAPVAGKDQPSVRDTKPVGDKDGKPGGKGPISGPVPVKDLSKRPMPKGGRIPPAPYPTEARRAGTEGPVVLQVFITKKGAVQRARVIKAPSEILARAAQAAMMKEHWTPPLDKDGKPVDTVIIFSYRFVLDG